MAMGAAVALQVMGGMAAGNAAKSAADEATNIQHQGAVEQQRRLNAIKDPELRKILLANPELMGQLSVEELNESGMDAIKTDPRLQEARMGALQGLMQRGEEGLTAQDKMQYEQLLGGVDAQEKARQSTIQSQMAQRGALDSGAQLAAQLSSSQGSANNARMQAMQMAADSANQRMQAQTQAGGMAGQMQGQDFSQQAQQAQARDAISRFNAANRQDVGRQNLAARQSLENLRAGNVNQEQQLEHGRQQQIYDNSMNKVTGQNRVTAGSTKAKSDAALAAGAGEAAMWSGLGSAAGKMVGGMGGGTTAATAGSTGGGTTMGLGNTTYGTGSSPSNFDIPAFKL